MSKKKHPEHVNHERWLVSYADFITLLFALFCGAVCVGAVGIRKKAVKMSLAMQTAFAHNGIFDPHTKTPPIAEASSAAVKGTPEPIELPLPTALEAAMETEFRIQKAIEHEAGLRQQSATSVSIRPSAEGLVVSLREAGFFASGSAEVRADALETFRAVALALPQPGYAR